MASEPFAITETVDGARHTLSLTGELDVATAPVLEERVSRLCRDGSGEVVLDLGSLAFIDSSGLNAILRARSLCEERRCGFSLTSPSAPVEHVFAVTRLMDRLPFRRPAREQRVRDGSPR